MSLDASEGFAPITAREAVIVNAEANGFEQSGVDWCGQAGAAQAHSVEVQFAFTVRQIFGTADFFNTIGWATLNDGGVGVTEKTIKVFGTITAAGSAVERAVVRAA